ncbi:hypothetical protein Bbelb_193450 [Branchiostoma belcheri]|nr:hypothetical protein Bbelb_193450 [Branchiostoma belcheri]
MYISYNRGDLSFKEMVSGALASYRERDGWDSLAEAEKEQSRRLATLKEFCKKNVSMEDHRCSRPFGEVGICVAWQIRQHASTRLFEIDYDFIAHMDTVASDVRLFVKKYNITANEEVLPEQRRRHVNDGNVFNKIYAQVPIEEILPLRETFQEDFDMFGYSFEQDLIKILQGKSTG